jgi:hypothetical protein
MEKLICATCGSESMVEVLDTSTPQYCIKCKRKMKEVFCSNWYCKEKVENIAPEEEQYCMNCAEMNMHPEVER